MEDKLPIPTEMKPLLVEANDFVKEYMSKYDSSHDYTHILRVTSNGLRIFRAEQETNPTFTESLDTTALFLGCLMHDVGDHKYVKGDADPDEISKALIRFGADKELAMKVQEIGTWVSYSKEYKTPEITQVMIQKHPELRIVQDSDRLDAIGAVGALRCAAFHGASKKGTLQSSITHFDEKLFKLEHMMKTDAGAKMAKKRTEVLRRIKDSWGEETELAF